MRNGTYNDAMEGTHSGRVGEGIMNYMVPMVVESTRV